MPVFKLSIKIIQKNFPIMMIYVVVLFAMSMIFATQSTEQTQLSYITQKVNMAFISEENSPLVEGFKEKLSEYAVYIEVDDSKDALQDALYFRDIYYVLRIPKGFTESFMKGEPVQLIKAAVPASAAGAYIDITIDQYFNTAKLYITGIPGITQEQLVQSLAKDLSYRTPVEFQNVELAAQNNSFAKNYFNYLAYSLFAVLILGISSVMIVLNKEDLRKRNSCAPISPLRINLEFLLAHLFYTVSAWGIMMAFYFILHSKGSSYLHTFYFMMNSFVFALCASSISFFIGSLVNNQNAISAICNVATLGPCFISGIFVPQELLGASVLKIASFTPTYWYAKANGIISDLTAFDFGQLQPALSAMLIEIGFAVAFLSISLVLNKRRKMSC